MSIVLLAPPVSPGIAVFERLRSQGDEVRVIERDEGSAARWKERGGFVALAREWDDDLIERASYEARTIVVFALSATDELLEMVVSGARRSGVDRIVVVQSHPSIPTPLTDAGIDHVVLGIGKRSRFVRRAALDDDTVARAVDAADDLAGNPRIGIDLTTAVGRAALGL